MNSGPPARRPASDVSPWVGLVGVAALIGWMAFARGWPDLVAALGIPGRYGRLSGPYSALVAMILAGGAMALWSLLVDKVHRNPSTGIDWRSPRPAFADIGVSFVKLAGLWLTWLGIGALYCLGRWYWDGNYTFAMRVIGAAALPLFVLSVPYVLWLDRYLVQPRDQAWHFGAMILRRGGWKASEIKAHWRAWLIKGFFAAFMLSILPAGFGLVVEADLAAIARDPVALARVLVELLFVIDIQIGAVGYILTLRPLDAHIRSGNPYLAGWVAALICYPPLIYIFMGEGGMLHYEYQTAHWGYWLAGNGALLWLWAAWLIFLTSIYAWATMAFGIRFSNLTYRGVLTGGPYRYTRHPAYLAKNLFWWSSVLPFLVTSGSAVDAIRNTAFLAFVGAIYYWRARTEEAHLLGEDAKYREYHAWMAKHGLITAPLTRISARLRHALLPGRAA